LHLSRLILIHYYRFITLRFMGTLYRGLSLQASVRLQAGDLILRGFDHEEIMEILEVSLASVQRWRKKVDNEGLHALA